MKLFNIDKIFNVFKKKQKQEEKKAKTEETANENLKGHKVRVRIYRMVGNLRAVGAVFEAEQDDENNNTVIKKEDYSFKEDYYNVRQQVITDLSIKLDISELSKKEQLERIKKNIEAQKDKISHIENGKVRAKYLTSLDSKQDIQTEEDLVTVNKIDEDNMLLYLKVLHYTVENKGPGSFEEIDFDGMRVVSYLKYNGVLFPYYNRMPVFSEKDMEILTTYADIASKRKHRKSEQEIYDMEYINGKRDKGHEYLNKILMIGFVVLVGALVFSVYQINIRANSWDSTSLGELTKTCNEGMEQQLQLLQEMKKAYNITPEEYETLKTIAKEKLAQKVDLQPKKG